MKLPTGGQQVPLEFPPGVAADTGLGESPPDPPDRPVSGFQEICNFGPQ
jgi:hypothetical protein